MDAGQRYCLECGARRAHLGGIREGLQISDSAGAPAGDYAPAGGQVGSPAAVSPQAPAGGIASADPLAAPATRGSGATAVIAGVGVLLLAMGIGVLIGRTGSSTGKATAAPQVIVAQPGAGAAAGPAGTSSTPTTSTATSTTTPATAPKPSKSSSTGVGAEPSKPAPPAALKNLHTGGSGQSYEQKSKALPNVVSTG